MAEQTPNVEPVNPLTGELTAMTVVRRSRPLETEEVQGRVVKPGLAITAAREDMDRAGRLRFNLTHIPTGLGVAMRMCGKHVQVAADLAAASVVDWTEADSKAMANAVKATDLLDLLRPVAPCPGGYCEGDGPEPPSYEVRCNTCDWEWFDEYDEGPLSREDAARMADDHECDPEVEIKSPITGKWHAEWLVRKAEEEAAATKDGAR